MLVDDADGYWSLLLYPILDEDDLALDLLQQLVETRNMGAAFLARYPQFDPLRDDPRFHDLLLRMNLEP